MRPLPVAEERWKHVTVDFITDLPVSADWGGNEFTSVMVVVDRMTKQVHITPCNDMSSRHTAYLFYRDCFRIHGLPDSIISDRGTQFTAEFWKWMCKLLHIDHRLSTAYHPQTDGQTERMNARIEQYLRAYVNYAQNDWVRYLPSAEFAINNQDSTVTGVSPFMANYGLHPRSGCDLSMPLKGPPVPASVNFERLDANEIVENAKKIEKFMIDNIFYHSAEQEIQANKKRAAARNFKVGDLVWLNYKNIKSLRPSKKLDFKNGGPFKIIDVIGNYAYKLSLPKSAKIHPVFHVSLLSPVATDPLPGQELIPSPSLIVENDDIEYEVEKVIGSHFKNGKLHYLVRWKGYGPEDDWSIPYDQTEGFKDLINEFHDMNPNEPRFNKNTEHKLRKNQKAKSTNNRMPRRSSARLRRG